MANTDSSILRTVDKWVCIKNCGACCFLPPLEERPELSRTMSATEKETYKSMMNDDGWCKNFDKEKRLCLIYDNRPNFCKVDVEKFKSNYNIPSGEMNEFLGYCCKAQIADVYGRHSDEAHRFEAAYEAINCQIEQ